MAGANEPANASDVLVVYGEPPTVPIRDSRGKNIGAFSLSKKTRASFEAALRSAMAKFVGVHVDVKSATFVPIVDGNSFSRAVRSKSFTHVIYYGHALEARNALMPSKELGEPSRP